MYANFAVDRILKAYGFGACELCVAGVAPDWDELCSSIRVPVTRRADGTLYGTRSQTVVAVWSNGTVELQERTIDAASGAWGSPLMTVFGTDIQQCNQPS